MLMLHGQQASSVHMLCLDSLSDGSEGRRATVWYQWGAGFKTVGRRPSHKYLLQSRHAPSHSWGNLYGNDTEWGPAILEILMVPHLFSSSVLCNSNKIVAGHVGYVSLVSTLIVTTVCVCACVCPTLIPNVEGCLLVYVHDYHLISWHAIPTPFQKGSCPIISNSQTPINI